MSITIATNQDEIQAGFNDIIWQASSSRNDMRVLTVTGVSSSSGFCRYATVQNVITAPSIQIGDVIEGSGFSNPEYNVKQVVTSVGTNYIDTSLSFTTSATGSVQRKNLNFKLKARIYKKNTEWATATIDGVSVITSSAITAQSVSVGDYLLARSTVGALALLLVSNVSGNTASVQYTLSGSLSHISLTAIVGSCYETSTDIDASSLFTFNFSSLLNSHLGTDFTAFGNTNTQSVIGQTSLLTYGVVFDEIFENASGLLEASITPKTGECVMLLNAVNQIYDVQTLDRYLLDGTTKKFLTDMTNLTPIGINQELHLSFITNISTISLAYRTYNLAGVASAWTLKNSITMQDAVDNYRRGTAIISANAGIFNSAVSKIDVKIQSSPISDISETKTFIIDRRCYDSSVILEFKNRQGGIDSYQFSLTNESTINVDREYSRNNGIKSTSLVSSIETKTLESRYDSKAVLEWLEILYQSKEIYMIDSRYNGGRVKVNLIDSDYIKNSFDLFSSVIEIELQETKLN